jgi:predicted dehydrogenase
LSDIGVGIIGYGLAGRLFHAPFIACTPGLVVRRVVTSDPQRVTDLARDHPGVQAVGSVDDVLSPDVDLVVVASPSGLHAEHARRVLDAGRHVVLDKPPAATADEFAGLVEQAERVDRQLIVFHNRRWDSDYLTLQTVLGGLGRVHRFETRMERWRPTGKGGWRESGATTDLGGLRYDLGPHLVDQALQLFGPVTEVWARSQAPRGIGSPDDDVLACLVHGGGTTTVLSASLATALPGPRYRVLGSAGAALLTEGDTQEDRLRAGERPAVEGTGWGREPGRAATVALGDPLRLREVPYLAGAWPAFYAGVRDCVLHGRLAPVSCESALATMRVLDAMGESARTGRTVRMEGT